MDALLHANIIEIKYVEKGKNLSSWSLTSTSLETGLFSSHSQKMRHPYMYGVVATVVVGADACARITVVR